jgi:hypothetical protein
MKKSIAILLTYCFLLGNIGLVSVKQDGSDLFVIQGLEFYVPGVTSAVVPIASESSRQDSDEDANSANGCQDESDFFQLNESLKPRALVVLQAVPFLCYLSFFNFLSLFLGEVSNPVFAQGFLPPLCFTHLRLQAYLQVFRN